MSQCSKERDSYSFNSSLPNIISSTEITRLVMAKEIKNIEDAQEQHLKDMAAGHAEESEWCVQSEQSVGCVSGREFLDAFRNLLGDSPVRSMMSEKSFLFLILLECEPRAEPSARVGIRMRHVRNCNAGCEAQAGHKISRRPHHTRARYGCIVSQRQPLGCRPMQSF